MLYIAAHPDDENTRLLAYLANDRLYRTGYLSLTRGDGGQNLIGDEQGVDLGLIRTQELLSARRIDGAEQFFSRAYDFGFCKTPQEALNTWGHDKILSDVVWVIRKFRPDVIITRFPEDSRAGHGHHSASSILAREAFDAAADPTKFPEQLKEGVTVWQAKRILWNTYNFGGNNTTSDDQLKIDCGGYNPLLGKSYGEIAALSRSQHKSQGFGVSAQRGSSIEYFALTKGDKAQNDLFDGIDPTWNRVGEDSVTSIINNIIKNFSADKPENSVKSLVYLFTIIKNSVSDEYWKEQKLKQVQNLIEECAGLFMEATTASPYAVQGDSLKINFAINYRLGANIENASVSFKEANHSFDDLQKDINSNYSQTVFISPEEKIIQPYWLVEPMEKGSFNVSDQQLIGKAENDPISAAFYVTIEGVKFKFDKPIRYKYTDPVKGELYEPLIIYPALTVKEEPSLIIAKCCADYSINVKYQAMKNLDGAEILLQRSKWLDDIAPMKKGEERYHSSIINNIWKPSSDPGFSMSDTFELSDNSMAQYPGVISYNHIPQITYFKNVVQKIMNVNLETSGNSIGYIAGAGDKVPQALEAMGYKVTMLKQIDVTTSNLKQFDAVLTGVRAYNVNDWMGSVYDTLMDYIKNGGVLLVQYNTNNGLSSVPSRIGPYPFTVANKRITDETANVNFLLPNDSSLNYPNKITDKDFGGWIQERSIYDLENIDSHYKRILSMHDPGEDDQDGSLIIADYGKGKFVYTGLVFFRELPAGVPGAYRLFANLLAK